MSNAWAVATWSTLGARERRDVRVLVETAERRGNGITIDGVLISRGVTKALAYALAALEDASPLPVEEYRRLADEDAERAARSS